MSVASAAAPARTPTRAWDVALTVVLLVAASVLTVYVSWRGLRLEFIYGLGVPNTIRGDIAVRGGEILATGLPWSVLGAATILAVYRLCQRHIAFFIPLIAAPLVVVAAGVGAAFALVGTM